MSERSTSELRPAPCARELVPANIHLYHCVCGERGGGSNIIDLDKWIVGLSEGLAIRKLEQCPMEWDS